MVSVKFLESLTLLKVCVLLAVAVPVNVLLVVVMSDVVLSDVVSAPPAVFKFSVSNVVTFSVFVPVAVVLVLFVFSPVVLVLFVLLPVVSLPPVFVFVSVFSS